jgi:hypothetical protein
MSFKSKIQPKSFSDRAPFNNWDFFSDGGEGGAAAKILFRK